MAADPGGGITSKQAEAQRVLGEIHKIDARLEHAVEAYDLANVRLAQIKHDQAVNRRELVVARSNLQLGQAAIAQRLVALYTSPPTANSTLDVLVGATSLDEMLNRLETASSVSDQDARVLRQVKYFQKQVRLHRVALAKARRAQAVVVRSRAATKASIESQLASRKRYLASVQSEIAKLQAQERAREARMLAAARARLAAKRQLYQSRDGGPPVVGVAATTPEGATVAPPSQYGGVVGIAMRYIGVPYVWGGDSPSGFDCSGFTSYVYAQMGVSLPHNAAAQYGYGTPIARSDLQPGDLVFFDGLGHVGIYIGGDQFIHAPHTGDSVKISSLSDPWYAATYVGARRL